MSASGSSAGNTLANMFDKERRHFFDAERLKRALGYEPNGLGDLNCYDQMQAKIKDPVRVALMRAMHRELLRGGDLDPFTGKRSGHCGISLALVKFPGEDSNPGRLHSRIELWELGRPLVVLDWKSGYADKGVLVLEVYGSKVHLLGSPLDGSGDAYVDVGMVYHRRFDFLKSGVSVAGGSDIQADRDRMTLGEAGQIIAHEVFSSILAKF